MKKIIDNENLVFPDYKNSVLNVACFIAKIFNVDVFSSPISSLNLEKISNKRNIVFIVFDGFGFNILEKYFNGKLPFFADILNSKITSVFPSTTASAISSIYSGKLPAEHGILGWALYFKEFFRIVEYLPLKDKSTGKALSKNLYDYYKLVKPDSLIRQIAKKNPGLNITYLTPSKLKGTPYNRIISKGSKVKAYKKESGMLKKILRILSNKKRNFVFAYSVNPDSIEHIYGVNSEETFSFLSQMDVKLLSFYKKLPKDTAVIITADHGLTNIDEFYVLNDDKELNDTLILPPFPESRFISFFVKKHKNSKFLNAFSKYENDFILLERDEFITYGFLGDTEYHYKLDDFLGDYLAIATGKKAFRYIYRQKIEKNKIFKAHHSGITKDEMEIPLFYFEK